MTDPSQPGDHILHGAGPGCKHPPSLAHGDPSTTVKPARAGIQLEDSLPPLRRSGLGRNPGAGGDSGFAETYMQPSIDPAPPRHESPLPCPEVRVGSQKPSNPHRLPREGDLCISPSNSGSSRPLTRRSRENGSPGEAGKQPRRDRPRQLLHLSTPTTPAVPANCSTRPR